MIHFYRHWDQFYGFYLLIFFFHCFFSCLDVISFTFWTLKENRWLKSLSIHSNILCFPRSSVCWFLSPWMDLAFLSLCMLHTFFLAEKMDFLSTIRCHFGNQQSILIGINFLITYGKLFCNFLNCFWCISVQCLTRS